MHSLNRNASIEKEIWEFSNSIRSLVTYDNPVKGVLIATILYLYDVNPDLQELSYKDILSGKLGPYKDLPSITKEYLGEREWNSCQRLLGQFSKEALREIVLSPLTDLRRHGEEETPESVCALATKILEIKKEERVADLCCGYGGFETSLPAELEMSIDCFDINTQAVDVLKLRTLFLDCTPNVVQTNVFSLAENNQTYEKIFSNYPFMTNMKLDPVSVAFLKTIPEHPPVKAKSSDWVFNTLIMQLLSPKGKAAVVMTGGSLFNTPDSDWRKWFVENGWIEAIISLPANMFSTFSIPTFLVVLSHDNTRIRLIDATEKAEKGRRYSFFTDETIKEIVDSFKKENKLGKDIEIQELRETNYYLFPTRYLSERVSFKNEIQFGDVIKHTARGAVISAKNLDEIVSDTDTGITYLQLKNIQNGVVGETLDHIKELTLDMEKHCADTGNLVIPKIYSDGKIAVIDVPDGQKMLVSGNMFILELDETKIYPYFAKAFLESEWGKNLLKGITRGTTIPTISLAALKSMPFPLPSKEEQMKIVNKYLAAQDEIKVLQAKLQAAEDRLAASIGDGGDWLA